MTYLDLGCHNGDSVKAFLAGKFDGWSPAGFDILAFDPLDKFWPQWLEIILEYPSVTFVNLAVADYDGEAEFSEREQDMKSSIRPEKHNFDSDKKRTIKCINLSRVVKALGDVIIRMDIEGEEYDVLDKLIADGTIDLVKYLEVEWHGHKFRTDELRAEYDARRERICRQLTERGVKFSPIKS